MSRLRHFEFDAGSQTGLYGHHINMDQENTIYWKVCKEMEVKDNRIEDRRSVRNATVFYLKKKKREKNAMGPWKMIVDLIYYRSFSTTCIHKNPFCCII